ncbi:NUDIX hydrolase [Streptomyces sp. NPDC057592]|uniref:NUDIX hydrolase n=1 Tax=unclassified Streptomyces TaxID=2593676 RepID=UPI0036D026BA
MIERVRAVLVTADDAMPVIRRTGPGIPECWALPGGESREAALHREIHEDEEVVAVRVVGGTY